MGWCGDGVWGSFDGHRDWLQKRPQTDPATGRVQGLWGRLRAPLTVPEWGAVCAFGKDHVTRAGNFDTGEQDAAEVVHQLAPSGPTSLLLDTLAGFTARPGFGVGPRIGWAGGDWCWLLCDAWRYWAGLAGPSSHEVCAL